ncbi:MAG: adenylosuccinate synthase [Firmicutes bacterium]|jgi:adenylosuccinate synthase|nr:adenylosuccinate synthase [Bacillota bacterium]MCL5063520.1 adenylosuccinate synthase [Bacillota bacterium]
MPSIAVVGANWGDEGKGKVTDWLAKDADLVVRFQGGNNAGHTVVNDWGTFMLHLLPSGVFYPHVTNILGPGVALNAEAFLQETAALIQRGVPRPKVLISPRAHLVLDAHMRLDGYEEERLGARQFGSTRSGMAPVYSDKMAKIGLQVGDLLTSTYLQNWVEEFAVHKNVLFEHLYHQTPIDPTALYHDLIVLGHRLRPWIAETTTLLGNALKEGQTVLLEGQLGALRDPDHGIYPYTTSSSTLAGYACVGAGVPPQSFAKIIAVTKAYSSAVGAGPMVSEIHGQAEEELRQRGGLSGEYGATTGRPRRVGWFDAVATRYGCLVQGATEVALTNLDVLSYRSEIPVTVAYRLEHGRLSKEFPRTHDLWTASPVWETFPGWLKDLSQIRQYEDLPKEARAYVEAIERMIGVPIRLLSVGPHRNALIVRH